MGTPVFCWHGLALQELVTDKSPAWVGGVFQTIQGWRDACRFLHRSMTAQSLVCLFRSGGFRLTGVQLALICKMHDQAIVRRNGSDRNVVQLS